MKNTTLNAKVVQIFRQRLQRKIKTMRIFSSQGNIKLSVSHRHSVSDFLDTNTDMQKARTKLPVPAEGKQHLQHGNTAKRCPPVVSSGLCEVTEFLIRF